MIDNPLNSTGRFVRGSRHHAAKLTEADVAHIREIARHRDALLAEARTLRNEDLARKFGVSVGTIQKTLYCGGWGHVV
jgi:transposase